TLELKKDNQKYFYLRYDKEKALQENKNSKLEGIWKFKNKYDDIFYLKFSLPDDVTIYSIEDQGSTTSTSYGSWMYNSKEKSILTIILSNEFSGKHFLTKQLDNLIEFKYKDENIVANKIEEETSKLEKLNFTEDDFPEEANEELPLAWTSLYDGITSLSNIKTLVYDNCEFIKEIGVFNCDEYKIDVNASEDNEKINFSIKYNKDEYAKKVTKGGYNNNAFFPEDDFFTYRVVSKEKITVPAGTFDCTVVEVPGDFGDKIKLWMINDKAGVYAKKIKIGKDVLEKDKYEMHILKEIIKK
ncbi:MAG: hypothetical protein GXO49_01555, partial [Chlorobi bacterium]|nr:hypothetical protein [Chlorobiota bacterium]